MLLFRNIIKNTGHNLIVIVFLFFSTTYAKALEKYDKGDDISNYFSGLILLNQSNYEDSYRYFKKLEGLETIHKNFSSNYIYTLINSGNFNQALNFSKRVETTNKDGFESDLIQGIYYLKNSKYELSKKYFLKASKRNFLSIFDVYLINTLYIWSNLNDVNFEKANLSIEQLDDRFENLKKIQNVFLNCYFNTEKTENLYEKLLSSQNIDFSRYFYFYAKFLENKGKNEKAQSVVNSSLEKFPRNLLLNQYKIDLERENFKSNFNCKKRNHIISELLYINANALSSQSMFQLSNFYLNLSKYLNKDFHSYDTLLAENSVRIDDFKNAKKIYEKLKNHGAAYKWYANKQISRILIQENKKEISLKLLNKSYSELPNKSVHDTFDYAEFLKNNDEFVSSIKFYTNILDKINQDHPLYPEVMDGRGVAYERIGNWSKAEKDLLSSLEASPDQAYVINYLAYSWIEKGMKINESLKMLERANKLKSNDPFIIDSLGWALYKLERYEESKNYLQLAVKLMPADPIVNDHYGDVLWKNGNKIQARYYWNYVLNLEKAEGDLKEKIEQKLIKGL